MKSILIITIFISVLNSCVYTIKSIKYSNEGSVMFHTINYAVDTTNMVDDYKYKLWYSDSSIIVERVYILFNFPPDSNSKPPSLETLKYDL